MAERVVFEANRAQLSQSGVGGMDFAPFFDVRGALLLGGEVLTLSVIRVSGRSASSR